MLELSRHCLSSLAPDSTWWVQLDRLHVGQFCSDSINQEGPFHHKTLCFRSNAVIPLEPMSVLSTWAVPPITLATHLQYFVHTVFHEWHTFSSVPHLK